MNENEVKQWKDQLRYADRLWYQTGITDDIVGSRRNANTIPIYRYIQDYRGDQQSPFSGADLDTEDRFIANVAFSITNTVLSVLSGRDPEPIFKAKGGSLAQKNAGRLARLNKIQTQSVMRDGKYKREVDRALQCALTAPFGLVRHGYTPSVEEYTDAKTGEVYARFKNEKPDFPWIRYYAPWDVRIDPLADQFDPDQSPRWVAFRELYTEREVQKNPKLIARKDWTPSFTPAPFTRDTDATSRRTDTPDIPRLYEAWTIYDACDRTCFTLASGAAMPVREEAQWPIEWGQLPYSILTLNEQLDSPVGVPFPKLYGHEQAMFNRVWTIINAIISRTRRVVFVNGSQFMQNPDARENLFNMQSLMEFIECDGSTTDVAREITLGIVDPQLIGLLYQLKEQIREIVGVSQFDRGQRANVETAAEANQIGAGAATQKSRIQEKHEIFWTNIISTAHRAIQQIRDDRKLVIPLIGEGLSTTFNQQEVGQGFVETSVSELSGDFDIAIRLNSTLPLNTVSQFGKAAAVFQLLGGAQSQLVDQQNAQRDLIDYAEQDPDRWLVSPDVVKQMAAAAQQGQEGPDKPASSDEARGSDSATQSLLSAIPGGLR